MLNKSRGASTSNMKKNPKRYFLINKDTPFTIREAYKSIRTNLLSVLAVYEDVSKHICFTSPEASDGKTLNCANIAVTFAEMGAKVLIIDADMRKPKIHRVFKVPATPGLSDCLGGFVQPQEAIVPCKIVDGIYVLPSGKIPPNPTELILSKRFDEFLGSLADEFDYIFIDAPPAGVVTDATIISKKTLGAILVCRSGRTKIEVARKAKDEIERGGGKVIGTLLNAYDFSKYSKKKKYDDKYGYYVQDDDDVVVDV